MEFLYGEEPWRARWVSISQRKPQVFGTSSKIKGKDQAPPSHPHPILACQHRRRPRCCSAWASSCAGRCPRPSGTTWCTSRTPCDPSCSQSRPCTFTWQATYSSPPWGPLLVWPRLPTVRSFVGPFISLSTRNFQPLQINNNTFRFKPLNHLWRH